QGTQSVLSETDVIQPQQGSLWGLGRVIALEHPELKCRKVDLDAKLHFSETVSTLVEELLFSDDEDQIAYRQGQRYVARLRRWQPQIGEQTRTQLSIDSEASYLITGGLGALGLEVAQWLVYQGAKHLILTGRRVPSEAAMETIQKLEQVGTQISVLSGDISCEEDVAEIFEQIQASLFPLKGVIHGAGTLNDGLLQNVKWEPFLQVMASKVAGTWNLHKFTQHLSLDFFVCFSSMASLLGSPGQGNYAAANAFMDAFAYYRRAMGLPGLSINWGPWDRGGMAARLGSQHQNRFKSQGIGTIDSKKGLQALGQVLAKPIAQVGVASIQWPQFLANSVAGIDLQYLQIFRSEVQTTATQSNFLRQLEATPAQERRELLMGFVKKQISQVLGLDTPEAINNQDGFFDLGMDSLMAVELTNNFQRIFQIYISQTVVFNYPTVEEIVDYLFYKVLNLEQQEEESESTYKVVDTDEKFSDFNTSLDSEEEIELSAAQELAEIKKFL
ncbi:beta-ketoacyl reductase, partial [Moorena sp. SIO3H5]|uniref:beta-ketoacyl reductase n=1 Tax=Moorena sp. SIO3H5 TaxID=2607834 RepID=UPI0013BBE8D4